ncbi:MAG: phosphatase PAP2 family protein [Kiritimatiellae bacterium]|nr:phosphatase PAP2 family protein [Kiritimatiellia bacterium]
MLPGLDRIKQAARRAALSPGTWALAAGGAAFAIDDWDERTTAWATKHCPIYGDPESADETSSDVVQGLQIWMAATALATPSGEHPLDWSTAKAKGLVVEQVAVELAALDLNRATTDYLKTEIGRSRPDGSDHRSFPSGHSADAFGAATLATRNLDYVGLPIPARRTLQGATMATAGATAWARVEADKHYPSDVLAAAALAHFVTLFIHDAFLGLPEPCAFDVVPDVDGVRAQITWRF